MGLLWVNCSITIKDYYLKLSVIFIGSSFVVTAICSLLKENKSGRKDLNEMKMLFDQLEEKFNNAFKDETGEEVGKWRIYIENVLNQKKNDDVAFCILRRQLNSDAKPSKPDIMQAFCNASSLVRTEIFWLIKQYRENMVYKLLVNNALEENKIKESISHLVILLEVLADIEQPDAENIHEIFANLAYSYKDLQHPSWGKALKFITLAIDKRNEKLLDRKNYPNYEINRILCNINLKNYNNIEVDFDWVWSFREGRNCLMTASPVIFPNFYEWLAEHKMKNISEWLSQHLDKKDDWLNMFSSEEFKEKIRRNL